MAPRDNVPELVSRTFVLAVRRLVTISVAVLRGLRMEVVVSAVAKLIPLPVREVSTSAQGMMPLLVCPNVPAPFRVKPPVLAWMTATPAPVPVPRLVPRNRAVGPL